MEKFRKKGIFFLPDKEKYIIVGDLIFDPVLGCKLELVGSLKDSLPKDTFHHFNIILGRTVEGEEITLYNCQLISRMTTLNGINTEHYNVAFSFFGYHFHNKNAMKVKSISATLHNFSSWFGISGINYSTEEISTHNAKFQFYQPSPILVDVKII